MAITYDDEKAVNKILEDNNLYEEVYIHDGKVCVEIHNGDWKHEHLRLQLIMEENGYQQVSVQEEPSDEDCYTATHFFSKKDIQFSV